MENRSVGSRRERVSRRGREDVASRGWTRIFLGRYLRADDRMSRDTREISGPFFLPPGVFTIERGRMVRERGKNDPARIVVFN